MRDTSFRQLQTLSLATALVGWSFVSPRLPAARRVAVQAGVGGLLVLGTRSPLGLRPRHEEGHRRHLLERCDPTPRRLGVRGEDQGRHRKLLFD